MEPLVQARKALEPDMRSDWERVEHVHEGVQRDLAEIAREAIAGGLAEPVE
jgi:hypothetical protein